MADSAGASATTGLRRKAAARLGADFGGFVAGAVAAIITSRVLGPPGQGLFAVLTLISALGASLGTFGLADAAVVQHRHGGLSFDRVARWTFGMLLAFGVCAAALVAIADVLIVQPHGPNAWGAIAISSFGVPITGLYLGVGALFLMNERVERASTLSLLTPVLTLLGLVVWVALARVGVAGAVLAGVGATLVSGVVGATWLRNDSQLARPGFSTHYLRRVWRYGLKLQMVSFATLATAKLDVLLVFWMKNASEAGRYSIALTAAAIPSVLAFSLAGAMFPRFASVSHADADLLVRKACRIALAGAIVVAGALAVAVPVCIPVAFGTRFSGSVGPTEILLVGGIATGVQWTIARAYAARGEANLLLASFALSLATMVALDAFLIPALGTIGAAAASTVGSCAGMTLCLLRRRIRPLDVLPTRVEFAALGGMLLSTIKVMNTP